MIGTTELRESRDLCVEFLNRHTDLDWSTQLTDVDLDIAGVCAHVAQAGFWYAIDFAAGDAEIAGVAPEINRDSPPENLIRILTVTMDVLSAVIDAAPPGARGFHPFGQADASGFAAMACDEMLIHTLDISSGTGEVFTAPADLAAKVVARLFPWVIGDEDPWSLLQWANGRISLPARPRLNKWRWHCAPLDEWDGTAPIIET